MCGFLGEISKELLDEKSFKILLDLSVKRGPDQQATWKDTYCQLGFNRLAILDLTEAGKQPMISPSGRFLLVFNGEIYNYKTLQKTYEIPDSALRSSSDSEVLCHLLEKVSIIEIASKLNGMFGIAVWDTLQKQLILIRDFSGIKPLYYGIKNNTIVFASQFNQVFKHPIFSNKKLRLDAMKSYFGLGYMHAPDTVFQDIFQVAPGQLLIWDLAYGSIVKNVNYYEWKVSNELIDSAPETKHAFQKCLHKVIKRQLQSDVPLGAFLSSGYDSSLIAAFAKQTQPHIKAFTFGVDDYGKFDERADASKYASYLKIEHQMDTAKESDLLSIIDAHFSDMPEPFGDYSSIPTYVISQKARQFATVMLSGDGGDELFWGYPRFRTSLKYAHWFRYPLWVRKILLPIAGILKKKKKKKYPWGLQISSTISDWILSKQVHLNDIDNLVPNTLFTDSVYSDYNYKGSLKKEAVLQYLKKNEFYGHLQRVLKKVDLMSMAHSLEVRVPFLDKEMIAFSNRIKSGFTITHNRPKLLIKISLYDFIPEALVNTEKKGFSVPIKDWLRGELQTDLKKTLLKLPFYGAEYIDMVLLETTLNKFLDGDESVDVWGLWHIYAWQKWAISNHLI